MAKRIELYGVLEFCDAAVKSPRTTIILSPGHNLITRTGWPNSR